MSSCIHFSRLYLIIIFTIDGKLPRTLFYWLLRHYSILVWIVSLLEGCYKNYIIHVEYAAQGCIRTCQVHIGQCCYHVGNDFLSQWLASNQSSTSDLPSCIHHQSFHWSLPWSINAATSFSLHLHLDQGFSKFVPKSPWIHLFISFVLMTF